MVVSTTVVGFKVKRILVDNGNTVEVLSWDTYQKIGLNKQTLSKASPLYGFANHPIEVKGSITLLVTLRDDKQTTTKFDQFQMVDHPMVYNVIFGMPIIRMENMVVTIFCIKIKFLTKIGVGFLRPDQRNTMQCHMLSVKQTRELVIEEQRMQRPKLAS
ncbi:hypothetical protein PVK06_048063 [Gossypium arboreum]|uniref:Uncharacterized protein n=1 Tax=Gossypium arboreum TaxID=29729 RepID=A0ABR0MFA2_GOSAR|nr:hypothetical protein PVK06_048063 [Gossypium arboreum]